MVTLKIGEFHIGEALYLWFVLGFVSGFLVNEGLRWYFKR